ncbi:immunity 22 family protein [Winogradskyella luteola]|uniref:Immunity 22 family protein n=1 Tax=Winogradskyella luteola TaxID=2828330 RepID=A0A9X1FAQ4_9FLAO|nr:immunity 22 family protein [Winogradskyella luteola]MBV7269135.1 immunity 22 family protein [Winogradskyella luteola]
MEEDGRVSTWAGTFNNEIELTNYMEEIFDDEGDSTSQFMTDFQIDYIDPQFQEVDFNNYETPFTEKLKGFSYINSFIEKLEKYKVSCNAIVCLYSFEYHKSTKDLHRLQYIGCFDYKEN